MAKPQPHVVNNLTRVLGDHTQIFDLIGLSLTFYSQNNSCVCVCVAMTKPHQLPCPYVFYNAHLGFWRAHAKFRGGGGGFGPSV